MGSVTRNIFKAIHEQKYLNVEYRNKQEQITRYWIGINSLDPHTGMIHADGLHLGNYTQQRLTLRMDSILSSSVVEGSYHKTPPKLLRAIEEDERYQKAFGSVPNLKILDYLFDCAKLNSTPYVKDFALIKRVDEQSFANHAIRLDEEQFGQLIRLLQGNERKSTIKNSTKSSKTIALNALSLHTRQGLYVLAYHELRLDVKERVLVIGNNNLLCREFTVVNGRAQERHSITRYLDDAELYLLDDFQNNKEIIKDCIMERCGSTVLVDDEPHIYSIRRFIPSYLQDEYDAIANMCNEGKATRPIKAFFGNLTRPPYPRNEFTLSLVDQRVNLDQLLAISQAIRYPLTYVQGPPGTGKTSTIVNTIINAYCNGRTVLFASFNNHPVDGVFQQLTSFTYGDLAIPFPVLRLGNQEIVSRALDYIRGLYLQTKDMHVSDTTPSLVNSNSIKRTQSIVSLLKEYEARLDLLEREECIKTLATANNNLNFKVELESKQLPAVTKQLHATPQLGNLLERAQRLTTNGYNALMHFLLDDSIRRIQKLGESRYADLLDIVMSNMEDEERVPRFNAYIAEQQGLKLLQGIFPVIATTCISAHKLGPSEPSFDITIIDEASQCDTATTLMPILRGRSLVLVGDPQQLNPVVMLDKNDNKALRRAYNIGDEYDYIENSVYKVFLACDSISNEILLHAHYRCDERIIDFNNKKYYGNKLQIKSGRRLPEALEFIDVEYDYSSVKNAAPAEADAIVRYAKNHPNQSIGVITPFANQRAVIQQALDRSSVANATCGTVHSFQGDEKDVVLFSLALTNRTSSGTYTWLTENRELINVATSRARNRLVVVSSREELKRLHATREGTDDIYELAEYVRTNGISHVTPRGISSRALGVKPYSTQIEDAFLKMLNHALDNIFVAGTKHTVQHEVPIAAVFDEEMPPEHLFYSGRFDFVVYEVQPDKSEIPVLAIELDGKEHASDEAVQARDRQKEDICKRHGFQLIRVENSYARRYYYIKGILVDYFKDR